MKVSVQKIYSSQQGFVPLVILAIVGLVGIGGTTTAAVASQGSIPGDVLYPVKEVTENVRLTTALDNVSKAKTHLAIADEKLNELEKLQARGASADKIVKALEKMEANKQKADEETEKAQAEGKDVEELVAKLQANLERQQAVLIKVLDQVPEQAKEAIQRALENSQRGLNKAIEMQNREKGMPEDAKQSGKPPDMPTNSATSGGKPADVGKPSNTPARP